MGWYTELKLGEHVWSWRKNVPVEAPLLFYGKHKVMGRDSEDLSYDSNVFVGYEATAGQIISNLDKLGLTLDFFKSVYGSYRDGFMIYGITKLETLLWMTENSEKQTKETKKKAKEYRKLLTRVKDGTPSNDIDCAINLIRQNLIPESSLIDDESLIPGMTYLGMGTDLNVPDIVEATTFGIFLTYAHDNLPEIAWLFEVRLVLETLSKRSKVKLDMKEWVLEGGDLDIVEGSIETLALKARTYNKTFDAFLGSNQTYVKEYERTLLVDKWNKLKSISKDDVAKGAKLEEFIASLFHKSFGFEVLAKNLLVETQELDIVLKNVSKNDFIKSLGSTFILIECKNWSSPVGVSEARVFESKYRESGTKVRLGIFVAINGVTKPFKSHVRNLVRDGVNLVVIDNKEIEKHIYSEELDVEKWLEKIVSEQFILK